MRYDSFCEEDTLHIGRELGKRVRQGEIFLLEGDLGVGKTVFAKGFAEGLGVTEPITSPTFTIIQEYTEGRIPLYHFDVYRSADVEEMYELGYEGISSVREYVLLNGHLLFRTYCQKNAG